MDGYGCDRIFLEYKYEIEYRKILKIGFEYIHMTSILKSNTNTNIYIDILSKYEYEYVQPSISILTCYFVLDAATGFALRLPNPGPRSTSSTRAPRRK